MGIEPLGLWGNILNVQTHSALEQGSRLPLAPQLMFANRAGLSLPSCLQTTIFNKEDGGPPCPSQLPNIQTGKKERI